MEESLRKGFLIACYALASVSGVAVTIVGILRGDVIVSSFSVLPAAVSLARLAVEAGRWS
jgi:hypothetical protein